MRAAPILFAAIWHLAVVTCLFNALETSHPSAGSLAGRNQSPPSACWVLEKHRMMGLQSSVQLRGAPWERLSTGEGVIFPLGSGPLVLLGMLLAQLVSVTEDILHLLQTIPADLHAGRWACAHCWQSCHTAKARNNHEQVGSCCHSKDYV